MGHSARSGSSTAQADPGAEARRRHPRPWPCRAPRADRIRMGKHVIFSMLMARNADIGWRIVRRPAKMTYGHDRKLKATLRYASLSPRSCRGCRLPRHARQVIPEARRGRSASGTLNAAANGVVKYSSRLPLPPRQLSASARELLKFRFLHCRRP